MLSIDSALDEIMQMDFNTREMLLEILQKRQVEAKRKSISQFAKTSLKEYRDGDYSPMGADEVIKALNS